MLVTVAGLLMEVVFSTALASDPKFSDLKNYCHIVL